MDEVTDEPINQELEKYKERALELKELEFKQAMQAVLHVFEENYKPELILKLDTEEFKFSETLAWLQENKPEEAIHLIQPAILEKCFTIVDRAVKVSHLGRMKVSIANQVLKIDSI